LRVNRTIPQRVYILRERYIWGTCPGLPVPLAATGVAMVHDRRQAARAGKAGNRMGSYLEIYLNMDLYAVRRH
jgi:hypothetical protein